MDISLATIDLGVLDELVADLIVLPFFSDERPLRGTSDLVDWRTKGLLSTRIATGSIAGLPGDKERIPLKPHLQIENALLWGLGHSSSFDVVDCENACKAMLQTADEMDAHALACVMPGRSVTMIPSEIVLNKLLLHLDGKFTRLTLFENGAEHRGLRTLIEQRERRLRVQL